MMAKINEEKMDKMWEKILKYEKDLDEGTKSNTAVSQIIKIIDEVYRECY